MKIYNKKYLLGDVHGFWSVIANHVVHNNEKNIAYIQVGDFNIGYNHIETETERLIKLNDVLNSYECDLYIMRGNHDNPEWFIDFNFSDIKSNLNRIKFIPDYTVLNIDNENILLVGGAISIDRIPRKTRYFLGETMKSWWDDEVFTLDVEKLESYENIDRIITHTSPNFCHPVAIGQLVLEYAYKDKSLINDLADERSKLTDMANILMFNGKNKIKSWHYGHFHQSHRMMHNGVVFELLGIEQFSQL